MPQKLYHLSGTVIDKFGVLLRLNLEDFDSEEVVEWPTEHGKTQAGMVFY